MKKEKIVAAENILTGDKTLTQAGTVAVALKFSVLLGLAIIAPALNLQAATGTLVNATLFIAVATVGVGGALLIGIIPSVVSAVTGLLPAAILPMVPFIIAGNALLVLTFSALRNRSFYQGVVAASVLKFAFLSIVGSFVIHYFVAEKVAANIALMMSYPQLFTALSGGVLAYFVLGAMKKFER